MEAVEKLTNRLARQSRGQLSVHFNRRDYITLRV